MGETMKISHYKYLDIAFLFMRAWYCIFYPILIRGVMK